MSTNAPGPDRFARAVARFDADNGADPNLVDVGGARRPRELVDAERLSAWVDRLSPDASEALRLAARSQHLRRFEIPRASYAEGRVGYLEWRKALSRFHADRTAKILRSLGYEEPLVERVRAIQQKRGIKQDPEVQIMEDALCLQFLEFEADEFSAKHPDDKVVEILRKTWGKMSERAHELALRLPLSARLRRLVERALSGS